MASAILTKEQQRFFLNSQEVRGVQSIQVQHQVNGAFLKFIGMPDTSFLPNGAFLGNVSLSTLLISDDLFLSYTGDTSFNGFILKSQTDFRENYSFSGAYITSYGIKCAIGEIPQVAANLSVFGNIGNFSTNIPEFVPIQSSTLPALKIAHPGSLSIQMDNLRTDKVESFEINFNLTRNPIYALGTSSPIRVERNWPIEATCNLRISAKDYQAFNLRDFPQTNRRDNLIVNFNDSSNVSIVNFHLNNLNLISESYDTNTENKALVNLTYKTLINRPKQGPPVPTRSYFYSSGTARMLGKNNFLTSGTARMKAVNSFITSGTARMRAIHQTFYQSGTARMTVIGDPTPTGFYNMTGITINDLSAASPYPSKVIVNGATYYTNVDLKLYGFHHTYMGDVDMMLVNPLGQGLLVMSDCINGETTLDLTICDAGTGFIPILLDRVSESRPMYKPTNVVDNSPVWGTGEVFSPPAPAAFTYSGQLSSLCAGGEINGDWLLYIMDDAARDVGHINGWGLEFH